MRRRYVTNCALLHAPLQQGLIILRSASYAIALLSLWCFPVEIPCSLVQLCIPTWKLVHFEICQKVHDLCLADAVLAVGLALACSQAGNQDAGPNAWKQGGQGRMMKTTPDRLLLIRMSYPPSTSHHFLHMSLRPTAAAN